MVRGPVLALVVAAAACPSACKSEAAADPDATIWVYLQPDSSIHCAGQCFTSNAIKHCETYGTFVLAKGTCTMPEAICGLCASEASPPNPDRSIVDETPPPDLPGAEPAPADSSTPSIEAAAKDAAPGH